MASDSQISFRLLALENFRPPGYKSAREEIVMAFLLLRWLILTAAILAAAYLLDGIVVRDFLSAFLAAAVLGVLNALFRPVLILLTLPLNILSLGLFTFIINAFLLKLASGVISGFDVHGFWTALAGALVITIVSALLNALMPKQPRGGGSVSPGGPGPRRGDDVIDLRQRDGDRWS
jgi:putative membrane protein